ncbi:hypothetical protein GQ55_5G401600 [Panicum hallii var. hallii]|jgi:hypothetical protein|uniref:Uncharacterized protein n=2 Tax=Panicum hallii TaxID=206008 RepID=A0A2T7DND7_9POAL|nr:hypothetical protein PAHAL_5G401200 [Panicum hallii]PUZ57105.1 hypothetical protein GQ55_5G401600 [Panicum hallii var. hallii]
MKSNEKLLFSQSFLLVHLPTLFLSIAFDMLTSIIVKNSFIELLLVQFMRLTRLKFILCSIELYHFDMELYLCSILHKSLFLPSPCQELSLLFSIVIFVSSSAVSRINI